MALTTNPNLRLATCVIAPDGNAAGSGAITWRIKESPTDPAFGKDFVTSVSTTGSSVVVTFPTVTKVHSCVITPNAVGASRGIFCGASVGFTTATIVIYQQAGVYAGYIRGNGTNWTLNGDATFFATVLNNVSSFHFNPPKPSNVGSDAQNAAYWKSAIAAYVGSTADRRLERVLSGIGSANFAYRLVVASTGLPVVANSTADVIEIFTTTQRPFQIAANTNQSTGFPGANILTSDFELHVTAILEL
jgi:hypothetical protein